MSADQLKVAILFLIALVLSITVHEFGHAWAATRLGDPLPRSQGRLSLSPATHVDPIGTLLFPAILMFMNMAPFGWGRPVLTNPLNYSRKMSRSTGHMLVAVAGPGMNLLMAALVSVIIVAGARAGIISQSLGDGLLEFLVRLNLTLLFFNLLPIPPLDGGALLAWVLPRSMQSVVDVLQRWGFLILLGLMAIPRLLGTIMYPAAVVIDRWSDLVQRAAWL